MRVFPTNLWQQKTLTPPGQPAVHRPAAGVAVVNEATGRWLLAQGYATPDPSSPEEPPLDPVESEPVSESEDEPETPSLEPWQEAALEFLSQSTPQAIHTKVEEIGLSIVQQLVQHDPLSWEEVAKILSPLQMSALQRAFSESEDDEATTAETPADTALTEKTEPEADSEPSLLEPWQDNALAFLNNLVNTQEEIAAKVNGVGPKTAEELVNQRPLNWETVAGILSKSQQRSLEQTFQPTEN